MTQIDLPAPADDAKSASDALANHLRAEIEHAGGWIGFDRFMQLALYEPGLGYYSAGAAKLGPFGDFTTSAELGNLLPDALADHFAPTLADLDAPTLLELGAGSGRLAARLIERLLERGLPDVRYLILEPSATLRAEQTARLGAFADRVRWLDRLPAAPLDAIAFGNEVADALPVARFEVSAGRVLPFGVAWDRGRFTWRAGAEDRALTVAVRKIERELGHDLPDGYRSEVCLLLEPWISSLGACIARGGLLLIDYGLSCRDYYRPERRDGTLICHYRHRAHADPFFLPGLQDITAWVDFTACARAASEAGLSLSGFTTQAQFLLSWLATQPFPEPPGPEESSAIKTLLLPGEMGEKFKLLWLTRGIEAALPGRDFRSWLE